MAEGTVTQAGYIVRLTLPPGMTPEKARDELQTCITFGQPEVSLHYILESPDAPDPG
jgi:hypothetical protein